MKKTLHKSFFVLLTCLIAYSGLNAQGGPDAFGYTWKDSNDPTGPVYNWIDITSTGTVVTGLGDDNSAGPIPMGMDFHFYWSDFDKIKFGSNGWISFDNISNIASCFPAIPTPDSKNNLICPLMSDLNFADNSPGKIYTYHDDTPGDEKFIISYEGVTHWTQTNPIFGSNTFQIILSNADSSITFQYADMEPDFAYSCTGAGKIAVGIENITGNIGLQVFAGLMPPSNYAVKFYYPEVALIDIPDASPTANINADNEGVFVVPGEMTALSSTISSTGNVDITNDIIVGATVQAFPAGTTVYSDIQSIPSLATGAEQLINFATETIDWDPGTYYFNVQTDNASDINPSNDQNVTEINVVDISAERTSLGYVTGANASGSISWAGGGDGSGGGGIEIEPPFYPATIAAIEVGIAGNSTAGFTFRLFDDDGPNGSPGTELYAEPIPPGGYIAAAWNQYELENPVTINDGSFYIGWFMEGSAIGLLVENEGPLANRSYEILSNAWAKYRTNADIMLRAIVENPFFVGTEDIVNDSRLQVYPNPNNGTFHIDNTHGDLQIENTRILNTLGAVVFEEKRSIPAGQQLNVQTDLPSGIYYLEMKTVNEKRIIRKVVVE